MSRRRTRQRRSRRNTGNGESPESVKGNIWAHRRDELGREIQQLVQERDAASGAEKRRIQEVLGRKVLAHDEMARKAEKMEKQRAEGVVLGAVGLDPILPLNVGKGVLYDAVVRGEKTLTTRKPRAARSLGLKEGEVVRVHMQGPGRPGQKIWLKMLGTYPTGSELIEAAGGYEEYFRREGMSAGLKMDEGAVRSLKDPSLYEISLSPPKGWLPPAAERKHLPSCSEAVNLDLYILPITATMAKRYLMATTLWMSDLSGVRQAISEAPSRGEAIGALRKKLAIQVDGRQVPLDLPKHYAEALLNFTLFKGKGEWKDIRSEHAHPQTDRHGEHPIGFGIYSRLLGSVDSLHAVESAFGVDVAMEAKGDLPPGAFGARSLADLVQRWEDSQTQVALPDVKNFPTFYRALEKLDEKRVVLVVTGPRAGHDEEGYKMTGQTQTRVSAALNMVAIAEALVWGNPERAALDTCFLLPPQVMKGKGRKAKEITWVSAYENSLVKKKNSFSPLTHFRALIPYLKFAPGPETTERVRTLQKEPIEFYSDQPNDHWMLFFGENPFIQDWPGNYLLILQHRYLLGDDRDRIPEWLVENDMTLHFYRHNLEVVEMTFAKSAMMPQLKQVEKLWRGEESRRLQAHDIHPHSKAVIDFSQIITPGAPDFGMYVPTRIVIHRAGLPVPVYDLPEIRATFLDAWREKPNFYLPPITAEVYLVDRREAREAEKTRKVGENDPPRNPRAVETLLQTKGARLGESDYWFLLIPRATVKQMGERQQVFAQPMGKAPKVMRVKEETSYWSPYLGGKKWIPVIARDLLRIVVGGSATKPELVLAASGSPPTAQKQLPPWTSNRAPYLFTKLPVYNSETGATELLPPNAPEDPKGYQRSFNDALSFSPRSSAQRAGIQARGAAREEEGPRLKRGKQQDPGRVGVSRGWMPTGFYALAMKVARLKGLKPLAVTEKGEDWVFLHEAVRATWDKLLVMVNAARGQKGQELLPMTTPAPVPGPNYNANLEKEALLVLQKLVHEDTGTFGFFFEGRDSQDLLHPSQHPVSGEEGEVGFLPPEVAGIVTTLDNPGRRPRRKRRPRRSRRNRRNPMTPDQWKGVSDYLTAGEHPSEETEYSRPERNEQLFDAMKEIFPRRAAQKDLTLEGRMGSAKEHDFFTRFHPGGVEPEAEERVKAQVLAEEDLGEADRRYLADFADLSVVEGREIIDARRRSKRRGHIVTPSGVVCKKWRNTARLKGYKPALPVLSPQSAWILVGKPAVAGGPTRVMSYRNGSHVDCDILVPHGEPLSVALGKAVQGMVLWIAEKPVRADRLAVGLNLGLIGSPRTRLLWKPGDFLDVRKMLDRAYTEDADVRLLTTEDRKKDSAEQADLANARATKDFNSYAKAQGKTSRASRPLHYAVKKVVTAKTEAEAQVVKRTRAGARRKKKKKDES